MFVFDMRKSTKRRKEKRAAKEMAATAEANDCGETKLFFVSSLKQSSFSVLAGSSI